MSNLKLLTGNTPPEAEPHIYAEDDAAIFQTMFGRDGVAANVGQACKATVLSNNKVRISDGVIIVGGHFARIPYGEYEDCEIENGQSGQNRNDIIMARFETTGTGEIDTMTCVVRQGEPGTTAKDPDITREDVYEGGKIRELPLYRVKIEGLSITVVEPLYKILKSGEELQEELATQTALLNSNMMNIKKELLSQAEANGFSSNALLIGGTQNVPLLVTNTATQNMPPDCKFGVREVISTSVYAIVKITGYSTSGVMGTWLRLYSRTEHKWYPWSSTSELYTLINNLRTDLVNNVNALVEYDKEFHSTADTTGGSFGKNFLYIDTSKKDSNVNKNSFWGSTNIKETFVNYPPTMPNEAYGIREVFWCNSTNILVKLTETYPVPGRQYFRYYAGQWSAWKVVTPT